LRLEVHITVSKSNSCEITEKDRLFAEKCRNCFLCEYARRKQKGFAFLIVKTIEGNLCPYCKAYEKVYGHKAHEPRDNISSGEDIDRGEEKNGEKEKGCE